VQPGDELQFRRPGVPEDVLRALRRGRFRVQDETDLHGLNASEATAHLARFLRAARARDLRCVRIIHGKGLRSGARGPVLKNTVNALLRRAEAVLAFASARPTDGGTGATLVLLERP
jgi:DNA-nicking Smr family endonuclease